MSVTVDDTRRLDAIVDNLRGFADVSCEREMAIICAVGEDIHDDPKAFGRALAALDCDSAADGVAGGLAPEHHVRAAGMPTCRRR